MAVAFPGRGRRSWDRPRPWPLRQRPARAEAGGREERGPRRGPRSLRKGGERLAGSGPRREGRRRRGGRESPAPYGPGRGRPPRRRLRSRASLPPAGTLLGRPQWRRKESTSSGAAPPLPGFRQDPPGWRARMEAGGKLEALVPWKSLAGTTPSCPQMVRRPIPPFLSPPDPLLLSLVTRIPRRWFFCFFLKLTV